MLAIAARAPSVHNTQPWRFAVGPHAIELYADPGRKLRRDRAGRARLALPGVPQMLLQFGVARTCRATPRRPAPELLS